MHTFAAPQQVIPLHGIRQADKARELAASMEEAGWSGRPLLVVSSGPRLFAWTGSHRIHAARAAGLAMVPVYIISEDLLPAGITAQWGHVDDSERLAAIQMTGDTEACQIMWMEGRTD